MFIEYANIDLPEVQSYINSTHDIPLSIVKTLSTILLKMPSQVHLVYNLLQPHLKYSLAFQLFNMTNNKKSFHELKIFVVFIDTLYLTLNNNVFLSQIAKALFNMVFVHIFQPRIIGFKSCPASSRTTIQYLIMILENIKSQQLASVIFHFLFGFSATLPYYSAREISDSAIIEENSIQVTDLEADSKSIYEYYSSDTGKELDPLIFEMSTLLGDREDSRIVPISESFTEDRKDSIISQQGEKSMVRPSIIIPDLPEMVSIKEYSLENHNSSEISTIIMDMLRHDHSGYSNIVLQLFNQLISFGIKEVYDMLIFNGIDNFNCNYTEISVEELIKLFPNCQDMLKNTQCSLLDNMYHGMDVVLSDTYHTLTEMFSSPTRKKSWSFSNNVFPTVPTHISRKSFLVPIKLLSPILRGDE